MHGSEPLIDQVFTDTGFAQARVLFDEYAAGIGIDLSFQRFSEERERIHEMYSPPDGCLLIARYRSAVAGCVAMRRFDGGTCEMKRLYVRADSRGSGVGRALAVAIVKRAAAAGYRRMVLDTLQSMEAAQALYRSLGFRETAPYYANPLADAVYFERLLF
jgi:ribosomal protein S18 acetylase RimI-like enzyme